MNWLVVFIGGGFGAVARFGLGNIFRIASHPFPWATIVANILASLFIGVLFALGMKESNKTLWLLLAVGFCGGLSTFSAFSLETIYLFQNSLFGYAILNVLISIVGCLVSTYAMAMWMGK